MSRWLVPNPLNADQAGTLAESARDEGELCAEKHKALVDDVLKHKGE